MVVIIDKIQKQAINISKKYDLGLYLLIVCGLVVYISTLSHSMYIEDSPEYITAAATLGIPHPSGYPLYVLLGKLFTFLPLYDIPWRVNLMSAVFAIGALSFLYLIIKELLNNKIIAFIGAATLMFVEVFWSQSIIAEVYTMFAFFFGFCLWLVLRWYKTKNNEYLPWLALVGGLGISVHLLMGINLFFMGLFVVWQKPGIFKDWRLLAKIFLMLILGLTPYIYLPWRSLMEPALDWGNPENWHNFWQHITRQQYNDFFYKFYSPISSIGKVIFFISLYLFFISEFNIVLVLMTFIGWLYWWKYDLYKNWLFTVLFFANTFLIIFLRKFIWTETLENIYRVYYFGGLAVFIIWLAGSWLLIYNFLKKILPKFNIPHWFKQGILILFFLILFLTPVGKLLYNYNYINLSKYDFAEKYVEALLDSLPYNAILVEDYEPSYTLDNSVFAWTYFQFVKKYRPDITIYSLGPLWKPDFDFSFYKVNAEGNEVSDRQAILQYLWENNTQDNRPIYTTFFTGCKSKEDFCTKSNGLLNKVYKNYEASQEDNLGIVIESVEYFYQGLNNQYISNDFAHRDTVAFIYYQMAMAYFERGDSDKARLLFDQAVKWDPTQRNSKLKQAYLVHIESLKKIVK